MLTVFYDGKCGLCRREIDFYQRIAPNDTFRWVDITVDSASFQQLGLSMKSGLLFLHVQKSDGSISKGVDAFILIWERIPRFRILSLLVKMPIIYQLAKWIYTRFAVWRFKRQGYDKCDI